MMKELVRGQRMRIADLGLANRCVAGVRIDLPGVEIDYSVFGLDAAGRLGDDRYMVFYNQPRSPCGAIVWAAGGSDACTFELSLDRLPTGIERLVIAAAIDGTATMGQCRGGYLSLREGAAERARFVLRPADFAQERALMVAELYRKDGAWRIAATAQGFNGGLAALVKHFGGTVADAPPARSAPAPVPTPSPPLPPRLSLTKKVEKAAPHLLSLAKKAEAAIERSRLIDTVARVGLVLDASGSMLNQYQSGRVQEVVERILPLAVHFDDDGSLDTWAFAESSQELTPVTLANVAGYVNREWKGWRNWMAKLNASINYEPAVIRDVVAKYQGSYGRRAELPAYVIFVSDGGVGSDREIERLLVAAAKEPIFWQFVGIGGSSYGILERFDTMGGRLVDNCNFFALDDLHSVSDDTLYRRLLGEFPDWLKAAKAAGVL